MGAKKNTRINWQCAHCGKRDIAVFPFQFDMPKRYSTEWQCPKCGKETRVEFVLTTKAIFTT